MSTITVRQALLSDLDALVPLVDGYRQFYGREGDAAAAREFLLARFDHSESIIFIAFEGGNAVGFTQLYPSFSTVSLARTFILNDLFVDKQGRRKGVGGKLIAAAVNHAKDLGAIRLTLSTAATNEAAQALYQAAGWVRDDKFLVYHFAV